MHVCVIIKFHHVNSTNKHYEHTCIGATKYNNKIFIPEKIKKMTIIGMWENLVILNSFNFNSEWDLSQSNAKHQVYMLQHIWIHETH